MTIADELRELAAWGGEPAGVDDVLLLTTRDTVEYRRAEFPGVTVEPIAFASSELTVQDWRFLMGAVGSDSFYLQLLNDVMRRARDNLTLDAIRAGINASPMSAAQQALASTRIDFAARFIDDSRSLRSLMRPGRVVIVDVRDEFIEKEQALGLFVTMLNVFAGAGMGDDAFQQVDRLRRGAQVHGRWAPHQPRRRGHPRNAPQGCLCRRGFAGSSERARRP